MDDDLIDAQVAALRHRLAVLGNKITGHLSVVEQEHIDISRMVTERRYPPLRVAASAPARRWRLW